jgi:hypothetical protein
MLRDAAPGMIDVKLLGESDPVCTENLNPHIMVIKTTENSV